MSGLPSMAGDTLLGTVMLTAQTEADRMRREQGAMAKAVLVSSRLEVTTHQPRDFTLERFIAKGGMGHVYQASVLASARFSRNVIQDDAEEFNAPLAIKIVKKPELQSFRKLDVLLAELKTLQ